MRTLPDLFVLSSTPLAAAELDSEETVRRHDVVLVWLETVDLSAPTVRGWNLDAGDPRGTVLSREQAGNILGSARLSPEDFARWTDRMGAHASLGPAAPPSEGPYARLMVRSTCGDALPEALSWLPEWLWLPFMEHPSNLGAWLLMDRLRRLLVGMVGEDIAESELVQRIESLREVTPLIGAPVVDPADGRETDLFGAVERPFGLFSPVFDALLARREPAGALHARRRLETLFGELHKGGSQAIWGRRLAQQARLLDSTGEEVRSLLDRHPEWEPVARSLLDEAGEEGAVQRQLFAPHDDN